MSRWFRIDSGLLDCPPLQKLTDADFRSGFLAAFHTGGAFAEFVEIHHGRPVQSEWAETRARVFARDDYTCRYCGTRGAKLECDHVFPVSRGGSSDDDNLVTACKPCNRAKRDMTLEEWAQ